MKLSMRITTNLMLEKENYRPKIIYRIYSFFSEEAAKRNIRYIIFGLNFLFLA